MYIALDCMLCCLSVGCSLFCIDMMLLSSFHTVLVDKHEYVYNYLPIYDCVCVCVIARRANVLFVFIIS